MGLFTEWILLLIGALVLFVPLAIYCSYLFNSSAADAEDRYKVTFKRTATGRYDVRVLRNLRQITTVPELQADLDIILKYVDRRGKLLGMLFGVAVLISLVESVRAVIAFIGK